MNQATVNELPEDFEEEADEPERFEARHADACMRLTKTNSKRARAKLSTVLATLLADMDKLEHAAFYDPAECDEQPNWIMVGTLVTTTKRQLCSVCDYLHGFVQLLGHDDPESTFALSLAMAALDRVDHLEPLIEFTSGGQVARTAGGMEFVPGMLPPSGMDALADVVLGDAYGLNAPTYMEVKFNDADARAIKTPRRDIPKFTRTPTVPGVLNGQPYVFGATTSTPHDVAYLYFHHKDAWFYVQRTDGPEGAKPVITFNASSPLH